VNCEVGNPSVNYKEAITMPTDFSYTHKKQTGGSGQYAKVVGKIVPLDEDAEETFVFQNDCIGTNIPPEYIKSCEKGAEDAAAKGGLVGQEVSGMKVRPSPSERARRPAFATPTNSPFPPVFSLRRSLSRTARRTPSTRPTWPSASARPPPCARP
jgi:hypothetical protein